MHKVNRMTQPPMQCLTCGRGNVPDDPHTEDDLWFLDLERDVNWGDPTYICMYCCDRIGVMAGLVGMQELSETQDQVKRLTRKLHDARASIEQKQHRIDRITGGAKEIRREKKKKGRDKGVEELKKRAKKAGVASDD